MTGKKENIKALFSNTRTRVIILFTLILLILAVVVGVVKMHSSVIDSSSDLGRGAGGIRSIPGAQNQTAQYAALQSQQNVEQAEAASKKGSSAIPTIIRTQSFGEGVELIGVKEGAGGIGFTTLAREDLSGPQHSLWMQGLKENGCNTASLQTAINEGASLSALREACSCEQLKNNGSTLTELEPLCSCDELQSAGFNIDQMKTAGFSARRLKQCGFIACDERRVGFSAQEMKDAGFSDGELKGAGFSDAEIALAGGIPDGMTAADVRKSGCDVESLRKLRAAGVTAAAIRATSGCSDAQLRAAGFTADELRRAGFTDAELKQAGFSDADLNKDDERERLIRALKSSLPLFGPQDCSQSTLQAALALGVSAETIRETIACSDAALRAAGFDVGALKNAGFTAAELKNAGFGAGELKRAGFGAKALSDAGFSASQLQGIGFGLQDLKEAGFPASDLTAAGFDANALSKAGFGADDLKAAGLGAEALRKSGISARDLKDAGFTEDQIQKAGFTSRELRDSGLSALVQLEAAPSVAKVDSSVTVIPSIGGGKAGVSSKEASNAKKLEDLLAAQKKQMTEQRYQQKIQQRTSAMLTAANQALQGWKTPPAQAYVAGSVKEEAAKAQQVMGANGVMMPATSAEATAMAQNNLAPALVKTGDVLFAVIDTSVNTDEPGPILASVVSGKLKGSKLIGSFTLPSNADKMVITFTTLSIPGVDKVQSISAYAIDPNTARTALSSQTDHHYLMRYGSLFASTFLEGFGDAFQSSDTTITIGGTDAETTVSSGVGRSILENAVIGLAEVGKAWGDVAAQNMSRPTTVEVFSGTGVGVLFTQDLRIS